MLRATAMAADSCGLITLAHCEDDVDEDDVGLRANNDEFSFPSSAADYAPTSKSFISWHFSSYDDAHTEQAVHITVYVLCFAAGALLRERDEILRWND